MQAFAFDARIVVGRRRIFEKLEPHQHLVISPYPKKYETLWKLQDRRTILLRPIKPEDEPLWLEMFQNSSEEFIRYRFFQILKDTPHEVRVRYCNIDYDREMAIVAELNEGGHRRILGVTRLSIDPNGKSGEIAFILVDQWQGLVLETKMVGYVIEIAKDIGVETIYAIMLPDNRRAVNLTKKWVSISNTWKMAPSKESSTWQKKNHLFNMKNWAAEKKRKWNKKKQKHVKPQL